MWSRETCTDFSFQKLKQKSNCTKKMYFIVKRVIKYTLDWIFVFAMFV